MKVRIPKQTRVLLYLPDQAAAAPVQKALETAGLSFLELTAPQLALTVQDCFEGKTTELPLQEDAPGEAMAVFCNVSQQQLDRALAALRGLPVPLKAVMTPTNRTWSLLELYRELCREREAIRQQKKEAKE